MWNLHSFKLLRNRGPDVFTFKAHSLMPEVVKEDFSNVAAFLYVVCECGHWVCFTGSSLDLEKYLVGIYILKHALLLVYKNLDFLSILHFFFFNASVLPVLFFVLVITIIAKLSPGGFCILSID